MAGMTAGSARGWDSEGFLRFATLLLALGDAFCAVCVTGGDDGGEEGMMIAGSDPPLARWRLAGAASGVAVAPSECLCFRVGLGSSIGSMSGAVALVEILRPVDRVSAALAAAPDTLDLRLVLPAVGVARVAVAPLLVVPEIPRSDEEDALLASDLLELGVV